VQAVGKTSGYTANELAKAENQLRSLGINMIASRKAIMDMVTANIDLSDAIKLANAARDLAINTEMSTDEVLQRLIRGIRVQSTLILRNLGLRVTQTEAEKDYRKEVENVTGELNREQRQQAFLNAALKDATRFQGSAAAASESARRQLAKLNGAIEDYKTTLGDAFQPAYLNYIKTMAKLYEALTQAVSDPRFQQSLERISILVVKIFETVAMSAIEEIPNQLKRMADWLTVIQNVITAFMNNPEVKRLTEYGLFTLLVLGAASTGNPAFIAAAMAMLTNKFRELVQEGKKAASSVNTTAIPWDKLNAAARRRVEEMQREISVVETSLSALQGIIEKGGLPDFMMARYRDTAASLNEQLITLKTNYAKFIEET